MVVYVVHLFSGFSILSHACDEKNNQDNLVWHLLCLSMLAVQYHTVWLGAIIINLDIVPYSNVIEHCISV